MELNWTTQTTRRKLHGKVDRVLNCVLAFGAAGGLLPPDDRWSLLSAEPPVPTFGNVEWPDGTAARWRREWLRMLWQLEGSELTRNLFDHPSHQEFVTLLVGQEEPAATLAINLLGRIDHWWKEVEAPRLHGQLAMAAPRLALNARKFRLRARLLGFKPSEIVILYPPTHDLEGLGDDRVAAGSAWLSHLEDLLWVSYSSIKEPG